MQQFVFVAPPLISSSFILSLTPLVNISFSTQPSAVVKIKDYSYNFHQDNHVCSPAEITPALQLSRSKDLISADSRGVSCDIN